MKRHVILAVDDNPTNLRLTQFTLERIGYDVQTASSAAEALAALHNYSPAVILLDLQLPDMNGLELAREMRAASGHTGVRLIALTASAMAGDRERALDAGCHEYLAKPFVPDDLRRVVARQLALKGEEDF